jgi:predicted nucleic acid-binding protein
MLGSPNYEPRGKRQTHLMSNYLLDTGIIIRHLRGKKPIVQLLRGLGKQSQLAVASITRLEVRVGMRQDEQFLTSKLLSRFQTYPLDHTIADRAGDFVRWANQNQQALAIPDAIIAATATQHQLTLVTLNTKDFDFLPNLALYPIEL